MIVAQLVFASCHAGANHESSPMWPSLQVVTLVICLHGINVVVQAGPNGITRHWHLVKDDLVEAHAMLLFVIVEGVSDGINLTRKDLHQLAIEQVLGFMCLWRSP